MAVLLIDDRSVSNGGDLLLLFTSPIVGGRDCVRLLGGKDDA